MKLYQMSVSERMRKAIRLLDGAQLIQLENSGAWLIEGRAELVHPWTVAAMQKRGYLRSANPTGFGAPFVLTELGREVLEVAP
jgi:hypothetical protein